MEHLAGIASHFRLNGQVSTVVPTGSGHINDSYRVETTGRDASFYLLQRINHQVFPDVTALMENIRLVTDHIRKKLDPEPAGNGFRALELVETRPGKLFLKDINGNYWRMYHFVHGSRSYDTLMNGTLAREAGKAYGRFQSLTADLDAKSLAEIIPGFHDVNMRLDRFRKAVGSNVAERAASVIPETRFVESRAEEMGTIHRLGNEGCIPVRVTHNDTKCNNVLFNEQDQAICVVDLDTVMPGYVLFDFGDAIRTGANAASEDEADLSKVYLRLDLFEAYSAGYLAEAGGFLTPAEIDLMAFSARLMTYTIGLRFLTDHLEGDHYFKTAFPGHNLQRARVQFKLLESMEHHFDEMKAIIKRYLPYTIPTFS